MHAAKTLIAAALIAISGAASAQTYNVEPNHTYPSFDAQHLGISWWRGKFTKTSGKVVLDRAARNGTVDIEIDASTVDFGHAKMNEHARTKDFFNVEQFPKITFKGSSIKFNGDVPVEVEGQLTLLGVTKPLNLRIAEFKCREHPMVKREVCGADAFGSFDRGDFGMNYGLPVHGGKIRLAIQIEAIKAD